MVSVRLVGATHVHRLDWYARPSHNPRVSPYPERQQCLRPFSEPCLALPFLACSSPALTCIISPCSALLSMSQPCPVKCCSVLPQLQPYRVATLIRS